MRILSNIENAAALITKRGTLYYTIRTLLKIAAIIISKCVVIAKMLEFQIATSKGRPLIVFAEFKIRTAPNREIYMW